MNLTQLARGRECQIRVPNHCLRTTETVVACHYRMPTFSGLGIKSPDWLIAFGCYACHAIVDGQQQSEYTKVERDLLLAEGVFRTWRILIQEGYIQIGKRRESSRVHGERRNEV